MTATRTAAMATTTAQLTIALGPMALHHPGTHARLIRQLGEFMGPDGTIEFTVRELAQRADVPFSEAKKYLRDARNHGLLDLLGRRSEGAAVRYCAYQASERAR